MDDSSNKLTLYGLYFGCPGGQQETDCVVEKFRNGCARKDIAVIEKLREEEADRLIYLHKKCLQKKCLRQITEQKRIKIIPAIRKISVVYSQN